MGCSHSNVLAFLLTLGGYNPGQTEITQFNILILVDKQIGAFEIAMEHIFGVEVSHAQRNILNELN